MLKIRSSKMKISVRNLILSILILLETSLNGFSQGNESENLKILDNWVQWSNSRNMLQLYLNQQAFKLLDDREKEIAGLKTEANWKARQQKVKKILSEIVGQFPEKTPLNPVITGIIHRDKFRVEKIVFESVPGFRVTGCLFVPEGGKGKKPAILNVIGHSMPSFRRDIYQNLILNLVNKGFIVFAIDPVGQGERLQYSDTEKGRLIFDGSTGEHTFMANQCLLAGYSVSNYFIWDGIRAIDYLLTREEVDPDRIGLTGLSGGGTQTAFISAFDDRVKASAPTCYITSYRRLLESIGPQDGEQNFYHGLLKGIDHADLLEAMAPRPVMIVSTTRDFFSIQGARETFREVKKTYHALGMDHTISMSEGDLGHGFIKNNNEATYAFFQNELNLPGDPTESEVGIFPENELVITPAGQVLTSYGGKTIFDLNRQVVENLVNELEKSRKIRPDHPELVKLKARELSGYVDPGNEIRSVFRGRYQRDDYVVELYALEGEGSIVIPMLLMRPGLGNGKVLLYIHPGGKEVEAGRGGQMEAFVKKGFTVVAPDLSGTGETRSGLSYPGALGYGAQLIGRSIVGIQAGDIVRVARFVKTGTQFKGDKLYAFSKGETCPSMLHAAVFESAIDAVVLDGSPVSYADIASTRLYKFSLSFAWGVAGALTSYDLPDLAACLAPRRLLYINPVDAALEPASGKLISEHMAYPEAVYSHSVPGKLHFLNIRMEKIQEAVADWLGSE